MGHSTSVLQGKNGGRQTYRLPISGNEAILGSVGERSETGNRALLIPPLVTFVQTTSPDGELNGISHPIIQASSGRCIRICRYRRAKLPHILYDGSKDGRHTTVVLQKSSVLRSFLL